MLTPEQIISALGLEPLPVEGGFFRQTYRSDDQIPLQALPPRYRGPARSFGTAIFYLLTSDPDSFSAMHRLATDEVYHFYLGDPVEMLLLGPAGEIRRVQLGADLLAGQHVQSVVPRGIWQGSHVLPGGRFALLGTTMAPGFDPADFELGARHELMQEYPQATDLIRLLTRS